MDLLRATCLLIVFSIGAVRADERLFRERIAPILEARCVHCHGGAKPKGGLSLVSSERFQAGGDSGPVISAGKPDESLLLEYVSGAKPQMPKDGKPLSAAEVGDDSRMDCQRRGMAGRRRIDGQAAIRLQLVVAYGRWSDLRRRPCIRTGFARRSTRSSWRSSMSRSWRRRRRPIAAHLFADCISILSGCRRRTTKWKRSSPIRIRTLMRSSSIGCSRRPITASGGGGIGWMSCTTAIRTVTTKTRCGQTPGRIATM